MGEQLKEQPAFDVATEKDVKNIYHVDRYVSGTEGPTGVYESRRITEQKLKEVIGSLFNILGTTNPALDTLVADIFRSGRIILEQDSENRNFLQRNGMNAVGNDRTFVGLSTASDGQNSEVQMTRWRGTYLSPTNLLDKDSLGLLSFKTGVSTYTGVFLKAIATENHIDDTNYGTGFEFWGIRKTTSFARKILTIDADTGLTISSETVDIGNSIKTFGAGLKPFIELSNFRDNETFPNYLLINDILGLISVKSKAGELGKTLFIATENHNITNGGTKYEVYATPNGSIVEQKVLEIEGDGKVNFLNFGFPIADGTTGQILQTNGFGELVWIDNITGVSGSGVDGKIAFWNSVTGLTYNQYFKFTDNAISPVWNLEDATGSKVTLNGGSGFNNSSNAFAQSVLQSFSDTAYPIIRTRRSRGSIASSTPAQLNDILGQVNFGSENDNVRIEITATENQAFPSAGGSRVSLKTVKTGDNFTNLDERLSIEGDGKVRIAGIYKLPDVDGSNNQVIKTDGSGNLSWANVGGGGASGVAFSPINVGICDTAPTSATTQYYYQTVAEVTGSISKAKMWGYSGSDLVRFGIYRGSLGGTMTLIGQGSNVLNIGPNVINIIAEAGQTLDLTAGEDLVVGFYADGTSWRTVYDTGISDISFGISNTANITTMPSSPTGSASAVRFALTLY